MGRLDRISIDLLFPGELLPPIGPGTTLDEMAQDAMDANGVGDIPGLLPDYRRDIIALLDAWEYRGWVRQLPSKIPAEWERIEWNQSRGKR